jgi:tetratricopeptide (TPR) repeat protein
VKRWRATAVLVALAVQAFASAALAAQHPGTPSAPAPVVAPASPPGRPNERAWLARQFEDLGEYDSAAVALRSLRAQVAPDADLDLALALDLARAGAPDSARVLLHGPVLSAALADSCPPERRRPYGPTRETFWTNGRYDGWPWAIARARAEVDARLGRWDEARAAARLAVTERPLAGREWLVLAVCAGHAGDLAGAQREARLAAFLDPMLPEAQYLVGLFEWRAGHRGDALQRFATAAALDSLYEPAVRARRSLRFFPGAAPDSLPGVFLTRGREAGLLSSPTGPKLESASPMDRNAVVLKRTMVPVPDSVEIEIKPLRLILPVLVDERGQAVLCELPWLPQEDLPAPLVAVLLQSLPGWRFAPAERFGRPVRSWTSVTITTGGP